MVHIKDLVDQALVVPLQQRIGPLGTALRACKRIAARYKTSHWVNLRYQASVAAPFRRAKPYTLLMDQPVLQQELTQMIDLLCRPSFLLGILINRKNFLQLLIDAEDLNCLVALFGWTFE